MGKSITIKEDSLRAIRESMVGSSNTASHNTVCVTEAAPEVDEFELGQESDNPPVGGNYCHVNEAYNASVRGDLDTINTIEFIPHEDAREEGYEGDEIDDFEPYYEIEAMDMDGNTILYADLTVEELFDYFPQSVINDIIERDKSSATRLSNPSINQYRIEDILYRDTTPSDVNNVEEVNRIAKKIQTGGPSAYLLTDGDIISFHDHIYITNVDGITPDKFIALGNIRLSNGGIELIKEPTRQQVYEIKQWIRQQDGGIYVDFCEESNQTYPRSLFSVKYGSPNADRIVNDIIYYFEEGIKPLGNVQCEEKKIGDKNILTESQESKSIAAAKKLVMQRLNYNEQEADEFVRIKLRNDMPSLRTPQGGKFILGVTRMFCDGELRTANDIGNLNSTLKLVASDAHINEYDRNLNGMSCQELVQRFAKTMSDNLDAEKSEINQMVFNTPSDYEIVRIDSFEQAEEYGQYVSWCVTHDEEMFDSYTSDGINQFYFCLKNGFKDVEEVPSEGCPLDEYGLSMIAVSVNENGMLNTCTCRWNHDNGGDDSIMNAKEVSQVIGMNFFEVFKPNNKWKDLLTSVMQSLANGEDPCTIFGYVGDFCEGFARVELNGKYNFINQEGRLLSDQWFDYVYNFYNGFAEVRLNDKYNFINQEGRLISDQWFADASNFTNNGFAWVILNGKFNFINQEGRLISDQWFDSTYNFNNGFAEVRLNDKYNFINQEGRLLSNLWFDDAEYFTNNGFAWVKLNRKCNFINQEGRLLSNLWFDYVEYFFNGFARVELNGKWNFINQEGRLLSNQWFDNANDFSEGFAWVKLNGNEYKLDASGNLSLFESKNKNKKIVVSENQLKTIKENLDFEVSSSEIDLSSFKKKHELVPNIWNPDGTLNSRVRLKLLDIADDFWEFVNLKWVKPSGIILTGSICNFNWSQYSDIDLHLIVDFDEIDEKTEFVRDYLDAKKNEWNNEHSGLQIMGYPVELYVQNLGEMPESNGIYDLEENDWVREPNPDDIKSIGLNKFSIKDKAAKIMTIIDDMYDALNDTTDSHEIEQIGDDAHYLWKKVKDMRKKSLAISGENGSGNIVYKILRRTEYLDKLWKLRTIVYDRTNSIEEGKKIYISENKLALLTESQESKSISAAKKLAMQRLGYNEQEADEFVRVKLRNDMPSLRTPEGGKFILGVTRMFCDGEINDAETIGNLNKTIKLVASDAHINEYDRNLNGMSAYDLITRFEGARGEMLDKDKQELASMVFETNNDYEIVRIDSFEQAEEYGRYVSWCVTHDENMFNSYTNDGFNQFYFCLKNGWNNKELFPKIQGENCPLDEYGLSMIAISVDGEGGLNTCTCRWNHDNGGNDSIMDTKQISTVIGENFYGVFKANNKFKEFISSANERLANGEDPHDIFKYVEDFKYGFVMINVCEKYNIITLDGNYLTNQWFDYINDFENGFAIVGLNEKYNFIDINGDYLSNQWFDGAGDFNNGLAPVKLNKKSNLIDTNGNYLTDQWFDFICDFENGFAVVGLNDKRNFIDNNGAYLTNQWFDKAASFIDGFANVVLNGKSNLIDTNGNYLSRQWFDSTGYFVNGFAKVKLSGKYNLINSSGQLISKQWFDNIDNFYDGLAKVKLNGKYNLINSSGQLISKQWFDKIFDFIGDYAMVVLGSSLNSINRKGILISNWIDLNSFTKNESKTTYIPQHLTESVKKYLTVLKDFVINEETVADGSSEGNPYKKRWKAERDALKNFVSNYGKLMQSKEDDKGGKLYKVYFDKTMSDLIGYNYCICVQWDEVKLKPKSTVYIRALDKFTPFIRRNLQYDDRGFDNQRGTYDDMGYSRRTEAKKIYVDESKLSLLTESKNSKWAHKKTRELMAQRESESFGRTVSLDDPEIIRRENEFERYWFGEGKRVDWFIVLEPNIYKWEDNGDNASVYVDYIFRKAQTFEKPSEYIAQIRPLETFEQLKSFIDPQMEEDSAAAKEAQANMEVNLNTNYQVLGPLSFDEANQYGNYSGLDAGEGGGQICYTQDEDTWLLSNYSDDETNSCYLLLRNDWKEVSTEHDGSEKNNGLLEPLNQYNGYDDYGLSMIFVWITPDGELHESNTRWNHMARYAPGRSVDTAMTETDIATLMGAPFGKVFNIKTFGEIIAYINEIIDNGESLWDYFVFDEVGEDFGNGSIVRIGKKYNVLSSDGRTFINDKWFDYIKKITSNYARIRIDDKLNVIDFYGDYVWKHPFEEWLDRIGNMDSNGFMDISLSYGGERCANLMNLQGEVLINAPIEQWPTMIGDKAYNSFGEFRIVSKFNKASGCYLFHILNSNSNLNDDMWFNSINPTDNFSIVRHDYSGYSEFNILSADASELALDEWVDEVKYIGNNLFKVVTYANGYDEQQNIFDLESRRMVLKEPAKRLYDALGTIIIVVMDDGKRLYFDKATKQFTNARL